MVNGVAGSLINTAVYGGSLEDNLKNAIKGAIISTIGAKAANQIGNLTSDGQMGQTDIEKFTNKFSHAVLGCAVGAATADSQAGCGAGALGALAGSYGAELFDPTNSSDPIIKQQAQQFGKLTASLAVMLVGGDAKLMTIAGTTAVNAVANNRQLHPNEINWIKENAASYAKQQGISVADAEKVLAEQAFRQVQFGAEGGAAAWDANAANFLQKAGAQALSEGGFMFYATPEQKANSMMYIGSAVSNADFYLKNGLAQPTVADIQKAAQRDSQIRANLGTTTNTAFAAAATLALVGLSPTLLTWTLTHPLEATTAGIITADTAAAITTGSVNPSSILQTNPAKYATYLDELVSNGIKFSPNNILQIGKTASGQIVFLESGSASAGLKHILERHATDFVNKGIAESEISSVVINAVTNGKIVGTNGSASVYQITYNEITQNIAVGVGSNGFIVRANPVSSWSPLK